MKKVYNERFYKCYEEDVKLNSSLLPVIYKRKTYLELKETHDGIVEKLSDSINELQKIKNYDQFFDTEELEFYDIMFAILIGLVGSFITTSEKLKEFLRLFHDTPTKNDSPNTIQEQANKLLEHSGQDMDQQGKFTNRNGGKVPFGFHRLFFGHDILSWKGDNPFQLLIKQFGFFEGIKKAFLHLIADTCSKQGLPIPGHSIFDIKSGDDVSNILYEISKKINPEKVQAVYQNLFTIHASDLLGGGATILLTNAYLNICNYQNKKSKSIFKMVVHITNFIVTAIIGLAKTSIPKINFIALFNFTLPLCSFIGIKFKERKIHRIQRDYIDDKDFINIIKSKIYLIYKRNYILFSILFLLIAGSFLSFFLLNKSYVKKQSTNVINEDIIVSSNENNKLVPRVTDIFTDAINLGDFPIGQLIDEKWEAVWDLSNNNIRILNTNGVVLHDFSNYTITNFKNFVDETNNGFSFDCPETGRTYFFYKAHAKNEIIMEIDRDGLVKYIVILKDGN